MELSPGRKAKRDSVGPLLSFRIQAQTERSNFLIDSLPVSNPGSKEENDMSDQDVVERLSNSLAAYDWSQCQKICDDLITDLDLATSPYPEASAKQILNSLRRKRQFRLMTAVADAFIRSGQTSAKVIRLYAQAMIDQGNLTASEIMLRSIISDPAAGTDEKAEAGGLLGRIFKQLYINAASPSNPRQQNNLRQAIHFYHDIFRTDPPGYLWHGINAVALLARAFRDRVSVDGFPSSADIANDISAVLKKLPALSHWDLATAAENAIALGDWDSAYNYVLSFLLDKENVDAFEVGSLLRQLTELWELSAGKEPGGTLISTLQAGLLRREGGRIEVVASEIASQVNSARQANNHLEKVFGGDKYSTVDWYKAGLQRCSAVGRVETILGKRIGTGFLVKAADFFNGGNPNELILLTNAHVISPVDNPFPGAIPPEAAQVTFEATNTTCAVTGLLWSSPPAALDATFVTLHSPENAEVCPLKPSPAPFDRSIQQRVYVIGYPLGGGLSISLQDSIWLDTSDKLLHYRTPTDPGSSGSPVFDQQYWTLLAIHHAGEKDMARLNGEPGTYEANEGIAIAAIQKAILGEPKKVAAAR